MSSKEKHIPLRMCVGCRQMLPQRELIRIVCKDGKIELDPEKKKFGRGAYICADKKCVQRAEKKNLLAKYFRQNVPHEIYQAAKQSCSDKKDL